MTTPDITKPNASECTCGTCQICLARQEVLAKPRHFRLSDGLVAFVSRIGGIALDLFSPPDGSSSRIDKPEDK